jgi:hypothetical protein
MRKPKFKVGDKIKLLDGSGIPNYSGMFAPGMKPFVDTTDVICHVMYDRYNNVFRYAVEDNDYWWDERGVELAPKADWKVLILPVDDEVTEGRLIVDGKTVKTAKTKKSKEDEYSIEEACDVITKRLFDKEPPKGCQAVEQFPNGTMVRLTKKLPGIPDGAMGEIHEKDVDGTYLVDLKFAYQGCVCGSCNAKNPLPRPTGIWAFPSFFEKVDV